LASPAEQVPRGVLADREAGLILGGPLFFGEGERGYAARFLFAYHA
jgi:hypothetical protein